MKKLFIAVGLLMLTTFGFSQKMHPGKQAKLKSALEKYHDNIDNRMKGPHGEVIYIGPNGGRFFIKNRKKIYVEYKGNNK